MELAQWPLPGSLFKLAGVENEKRAQTWSGAVRDTFPSLSVRLTDPCQATGTISRIGMGSGDFYEISSAPVDVTHRAPSQRGASGANLSLMIQAKGTMIVRQGGQAIELAERGMCIIDETRGFQLVGEGYSRILFLRMSRNAALSRHPLLEKLLGTAFDAEEPGTQLLVETLLRFGEAAWSLSDLQRTAMLNAVIQLLSMAGTPAKCATTPEWRVRRALDFIELNLSVSGITAETVARDQRISRRRLDQLMHDVIGQSIAEHLWHRRLQQASCDLSDPCRAHLSIAQIAFANGFEDAAHFTRAFKRRFVLTPRQYREN